MSNWQPIETAPKDGTPIILFGGDPPAGWTLPGHHRCSISYWHETRWIEATGELCSEHDNPTHWQPLPPPPPQ